MRSCYILILIFFTQNPFFAQVSNNLDSLLTAEKTMSDSPEKSKLYIHIGFNYSKRNSELAKKYFFKAINLSKLLKEDKYLSSGYSQLSLHYNNQGVTDSADYYLVKTKEVAERANQNKIWASYYQSATVINKKRKNLQQALFFSKKYLEYSKLLGAKPDIAGGYLNMGNCYYELKQYRSAVDSYFSALRIFEEAENSGGKSYCLTAIGNVYKEMGQHKDAIKYAMQSLVIKEKLKDERAMASSNMLISESYYGLRDFNNAHQFLDKSITINKKLNLPFELVNNYRLKGRIFTKTKDSLNAVKYFDMAIEEAKNLEIPKILDEINKERNEIIQIKEVKVATTVRSIKKLESAKKVKDTGEIIDNLENLADYYYKKGDYKKAYEYKEEFDQLKNEVYAPSILKQLKEKENRYELEKRESAIKLLQKNKQLDRIKLQRQKIIIYSVLGATLLLVIIGYLFFSRSKIRNEQKRMQELDRIRKEIAGDLHDDIGSTLSSIQIMSSLIQNQSKENPKLNRVAGNIHELSNKIANGIKEIVWSVNPEHDRLSHIISQMKKIIGQTSEVGHVKMNFIENIENPNIEINPKVRKEFFLIYKEGINNAIKYSNSEIIDILVSQTKNNLELTIKDFGNGFDIHQVERGNGLNNMERRAEAINAHLEIISEKNMGTSIYLRIFLP